MRASVELLEELGGPLGFFQRRFEGLVEVHALPGKGKRAEDPRTDRNVVAVAVPELPYRLGHQWHPSSARPVRRHPDVCRLMDVLVAQGGIVDVLGVRVRVELGTERLRRDPHIERHVDRRRPDELLRRRRGVGHLLRVEMNVSEAQVVLLETSDDHVTEAAEGRNLVDGQAFDDAQRALFSRHCHKFTPLRLGQQVGGGHVAGKKAPPRPRLSVSARSPGTACRGAPARCRSRTRSLRSAWSRPSSGRRRRPGRRGRCPTSGR